MRDFYKVNIGKGAVYNTIYCNTEKVLPCLGKSRESLLSAKTQKMLFGKLSKYDHQY